MAVMRSKDGKDLMIDCGCGCCDGIRLKIDKGTEYPNHYFLMTYTNSNFYRDANNNLKGVFLTKLKKIISIIKNKDYYYSDIRMNESEFREFQKYIVELSTNDTK